MKDLEKEREEKVGKTTERGEGKRVSRERKSVRKERERERSKQSKGLYDVYMFGFIQIKEVEGLGHFSHLRVLNLAGNEITVVHQMKGLLSLTELNLRRNRITHVVCR